MSISNPPKISNKVQHVFNWHTNRFQYAIFKICFQFLKTLLFNSTASKAVSLTHKAVFILHV